MSFCGAGEPQNLISTNCVERRSCNIRSEDCVRANWGCVRLMEAAGDDQRNVVALVVRAEVADLVDDRGK
jgi:hypothetical protein